MLIMPATGDIQAIETYLRALLSADSSLTALYTAPIRGYPMDAVSTTDDVTLAVYVIGDSEDDETFCGRSLSLRGEAQIRLHEAEDADPEPLRIRLQNLAGLVRKALRRLALDPATVPLYDELTIAGGNSAYARERQSNWEAVIPFTIRADRDEP